MTIEEYIDSFRRDILAEHPRYPRHRDSLTDAEADFYAAHSRVDLLCDLAVWRRMRDRVRDLDNLEHPQVRRARALRDTLVSYSTPA